MNELLPGDLVKLPDGSESFINSAHYSDCETITPRQMFSICPPNGKGPYPGPLFYADECTLIHRHNFKPYGPVKRCECGEIHTTVGDSMLPHKEVKWH